MPRAGHVIVAAFAALVAAPVSASEWPAMMPPSWGGRGPGGGLALLPAVTWWLVTLAWMASVDWVSRDAVKHKFTPAFWGMVCGLPLFLAALLTWWLPSFLLGLPLMLVALAAPVVTYAVFRNSKLPPSERVLTTGHARRIAARLLGRVGIEIDPGFEEGDLIPKVVLAGAGGKDAAENAARLEAAGKLPGFEELVKILLGAVMSRATTLLVDLEQAGTAVRHEVDGVWEKAKIRQPVRGGKVKESWVEAPKSSLEQGQAAAAALKALCGLPTNVREAKSAPFLMQVDGKPRNCRLSIRRQPTGEQLAVQIEAPAAIFKKLDDLGMPKPMADKLVELTRVEKGVILVSAPLGSGLSTTFDIVLLSVDRLLRDFISIEDAAAPPREIQNVRPVPYDARTGTTPLQVLADVLQTYPNAIVTRDVADRKFVAELVRLAAEDKLVIMSLKATDATDAIGRVAACGVPPQQLATSLVASLGQRLVRKLCPKCREEYPTPPALLTQLKLTPEQLPHLRKASEHGCRLCGGTGYLGRTAIFELASGTTVRKAVAAAVDPTTLRKAAMQDGMKPLRDAGMALVVSGVTSIDEVQRVLAPKAQPTVPSQPGAPPGARKS